MEDDDVLTQQEEDKIKQLLEIKHATSIMPMVANMPAIAGVASLELTQFTFERRLGFNPHVTITNISGKKAWVILAPAPIVSVESIGIDKIGNISFSTKGDYQCQQILLTNNKTDDYELDTSQLYYSVFF